MKPTCCTVRLPAATVDRLLGREVDYRTPGKSVPVKGSEKDCRTLKNTYFRAVIVSATELANDSKSVLDRVIAAGEPAAVQRHGKTVAELRPMPGVGRAELLRRLRGAGLGPAASKAMQGAMAANAEVFGHAGCD